MNYAEMTYFEGYAFHHIAAWHEYIRLRVRRQRAIRAIEGR